MKNPGNHCRRFFASSPTSLAVLVACALPDPVAAHIRHDGGGGFLAGLAHPVSGLDHILAMIAVGIWGAQLGAPAIWLLPVTFPMVMAFGGFLGLIGVKLHGDEIMIALSATCLGAAILLSARPALWVTAGIVGIFGLFHGYAHGAELPPGQGAALYSFGFLLATGLLHFCGILIGVLHRWRAGRMALQGAGAAILSGGCYFLWHALA